MPEISVIIPACRAEGFIARAAGSLLAQTMRDWEAIIVSDDRQDYEAILHAQGIRDRRFRFESTGRVASGPAAARNRGLCHASGQIIAALDSDDLFHPRRLEIMAPLARTHGFVTSAFEMAEDAGARGGRLLATNAGLIGDRLVSAAEYPFINFSANTVVVFDRRRVSHAWPETLAIFEDLVFSVMAYNTLEFTYHVDQALYYYIRRQGSLCNMPETAELFTRVKGEVRHILKTDPSQLGIMNPEAAAALARFVDLSLRAEIAYGAARVMTPEVTFCDVILQTAAQEGITLPIKVAA